MKHIGKMRRSRFYAFAFNEFRFFRISFSCHNTQVAAEASAYKKSGQSRFQGVRSGDRAAQSDLYPQIIAGLEGLEEWAKDSYYDIDWNEKILIYTGEK